MSENAKVKAKLTAPYMRRSEMDSPYVEFPNTLHVDFYNDSLKIESVMDAQYGKWKEQDGKVYLRDSVVVKNILKGDTLYCKELWWDQKAEKFYTDKPVQIHKAGGTILVWNRAGSTTGFQRVYHLPDYRTICFPGRRNA